GRPRDSPRGRARARRGDAHPRVSRLSRTHTGAASRYPARADDIRIAPRGVRLEPVRRRRPDRWRNVPDRRRPSRKRAAAPALQPGAPTSPAERIRLAVERTDGWLYLVTLTGTTGARDDVSPALAGLVERARRLGDGVPLYAGFGISTPDHARGAAELADGIVVGSRAVQVAEDGPAALRDYVRSLRGALDG